MLALGGCADAPVSHQRAAFGLSSGVNLVRLSAAAGLAFIVAGCFFPGDPIHNAERRPPHLCPSDPEGKPCDRRQGAGCTGQDWDYECVDGTWRLP